MRSAFMRARKAQAASSYQSSFPPGEQLWGQRGWEEGSLQAQDCGASSRLGPTLPVAGGVTASLHEANLLSLTCWPFLNPFLLMDIFPPDFLWFFHLCTSFKGQSEYDCFRSERQNSGCFWEKRRRNAQGSLYKLAFLSLPCLLELRLNPGTLAPLSSWPFIRRNREFSVGTRSTVNLYQSQDEMLIIVLG